MPGWWILDGPGWPPDSKVVATFGRLDEAVAYVRKNQPSQGRGRPTSGLNDDVVSYALRAAGKGKVRKAAEILGVHYHTLRAFLALKVDNK